MKNLKIFEEYIDFNDWEFDEDVYPINVKFKKKNGNNIPNFFTEEKIPKYLIFHGSTKYDKNEPIQIVDKYKEFNIVRYTDIFGQKVQLGFRDEDLKF